MGGMLTEELGTQPPRPHVAWLAPYGTYVFTCRARVYQGARQGKARIIPVVCGSKAKYRDIKDYQSQRVDLVDGTMYDPELCREMTILSPVFP